MPRRAEITPRTPEPDPVYSSQLVQQLVNRVMTDGKKSVAEHIVYTALESIGTKTGRPPVEVLEQAVKTVTPVLEVRSRRVGGDVVDHLAQLACRCRVERVTQLAEGAGEDGQLGVGRLSQGTCNHERIIYEGFRRCQYEDLRSAAESAVSRGRPLLAC